MVQQKITCVFKICCKDPLITECYIGSTTNYNQKKYTFPTLSKTSKQPVYELIRNNKGWANWRTCILETLSTDNQDELLKREDYWREQLNGELLNSRTPKLTAIKNRKYHKEYYELNKEAINSRTKIYKMNNIDKIRETNRKYREKNKDKLREYYKENRHKYTHISQRYYDKNREIILEKQKALYYKNREKRLEYNRERYRKNPVSINRRYKVKCDLCGKEVDNTYLKKHQSKGHSPLRPPM